MPERRFSGEQLLRWFESASVDERDRLIDGWLTHVRYRNRWRIAAVKGETIIALSDDGGPGERRLTVKAIVEQDYALVLGEGQAALAEAIATAKPPPPPLSLDEQIRFLLTEFGGQPDRFRDTEEAVFVVDCWIDWREGRPVDDNRQQKFFELIRNTKSYEFGIPALRDWLSASEERRGGDVDVPRRLRLATILRASGQPALADECTVFVDQMEPVHQNERIALLTLCLRTAVLLDLAYEPHPHLSESERQERRCALVFSARKLFARAESLRPHGERPDRPKPSTLTGEDPFDLLGRRADRALHDFGAR